MSLSILSSKLTSESTSHVAGGVGRERSFFCTGGAEAFRRDDPQAEVHFYPTGHFALETHCQEIAATVRDFLDRILGPRSGSAQRS